MLFAAHSTRSATYFSRGAQFTPTYTNVIILALMTYGCDCRPDSNSTVILCSALTQCLLLMHS